MSKNKPIINNLMWNTVLLKLRTIAGIFIASIILFLAACKEPSKKMNTGEKITDGKERRVLYNKLIELVSNEGAMHGPADSAVFLILPIESSCPSCRKKVIDSIIKYQNYLPTNHFIILSASAGRKIIRSYFLEQGKDLPEIPGQLFIDSMNKASQLELYETNPTVYYAADEQVYEKNSVIPATIKADLKRYFTSAGR